MISPTLVPTRSIVRDGADIDIVGLPRPVDPIGNSLRTVFNGAPIVPEDMIEMLRVLDHDPILKH